MTITPAAQTDDQLTPGQRRTANARAARAVQANAKAAARLRAAGYVVLTGHQIRAMAGSVARTAEDRPSMAEWVRGFGDGLKAVVDVSDDSRE